MKRPLSLSLLVAALVTITWLPAHAAVPETKSVTVDYVIGLLDAGIDQADIAARIEERNLSFRIAPGDVDRLRQAGAAQELIDRILGGSVVLENRPGAPTGAWGRPSRLGGKEGASPGANDSSAGTAPAPAAVYSADDEAEDTGEGIEELPYGGSYGYPGYGPYYGGSYGYASPYYYSPYYYSPYYYPYRSYAYYSSPYCHYPGYSHRGTPHGGGSPRGVPRGGGGGGGQRPSPRGSHHH